MNKTPIVSVIIPVYNYESYIEAAIKSVLAQSFAEWELIVVDDHSSDRTPEIIASYSDGEKIRFFRNEQNIGQFPTHNRGAKLARGKYIKFLHGDDIMYPHCLEIMVTLMEAYPEARLGISHNPYPWVAPKLFSSLKAWQLHLSGKSSLLTHGPSGTIFRADAFRSIGGFDPRYHSSDVKMNLTMAMHFSVLLLPDGLWWYRHHGQQVLAYMTANDISAKESIKWYPELLEDVKNPLSESELQAERQRTQHNFLRLCLYHVRHGRISRAWDIWKASGLPKRTWLKLLEPIPNRPKVNIETTSPVDWSIFPGKPGRLNSRDSIKAKTSNSSCEQQIKNREQPIIQEKNSPDKNLQITNNFFYLTDNPFVSVLIPAYNAERYVRETIESVLTQRYKGWELIIVDDASSDRTYNIAKTYEDGTRIRCYRNEKNLGKWSNHNRCAELAKGKYLKFLHADDLLYPHCLKLMAYMMEKSDTAIGISIGNLNQPAGTVLNPEETWRQEFRSYPILQEGLTPAIYRKDYFDQAERFHLEYEPACRHLALRISKIAGCVIMPTGLYWVRRNANILPRIACAWKQGELQGGLWQRAILQSEDCPLKPAEKNAVTRGLLGGTFRLILKNLLLFDPITAKRILQEQSLSILELRFIFSKKPWISVYDRKAPYREKFPSDFSLFPNELSSFPGTKCNNIFSKSITNK